jgi:tetratricopeptide (TPR) repeat protein
MAIATGEVIAGGGRTIGEPLSAAGRLAMSAESGTVVLDGTTHRLLRHVVTVEDRGGALMLLDVHEQPLARRPSPLVGRGRELRRVRDVFEQAIGDGACQMLTVLGSAGVGKSRLVDELLEDIQGVAAATRGRCLPYGEGITFWPVMEAVKELVELDDADSPATARAKLVSALGDEQDAEVVAQRVAEVIGLAEVALGGEEGFAAVRRLLETLARAEPIVVVFDDIHWGEPTFLDLIEHLSDRIRDSPILLICLARPDLLDLRPDWGGGKLNSTTILLEPLSDAESTKLVEELAGADLEDSTRVRIVEVAEGNPLFVEEMLALALDSEPDAELVVPPTIHALLAARLDRLAEPDRAVVELAAVQGKVFYEDGIAELSSDGLRPRVQSALASLVQKELIRPERASFGGSTFRFRHILIRDAAYEAIPKEARSEMHEDYGRWLEQATGDRVTEYEEIVGYHLEQAYHYRAELGPVDDRGRAVAREAAERLGAAGRRAFVRNDSPAGVNLISRAVAVLPPDDPLRVDLLPNVRAVQGVGIDMSWAERVLTEAVEAAATTGDRRLVAHALVQRGFLRLLTGVDVAPADLLGVAERATAVFQELGDDHGLAQAWRLAGQAHYLDRHLARCADALEQALAHARDAGDDLEVRESVEWLTIALLLGPTPAGIASERCRSLLSEVSGWPVLKAIVASALATLHAMQGDAIASEALLRDVYRGMDDYDDPVWILPFNFALARMESDVPQAEFQLRRVYEELERVHKSHFSSQAVVLARLTYAQGRYEEAEALTTASERAAHANDVYSQIAWRSTRAKVLARKGELDEAVRLARDAVAVAETSDALIAHADACMDLAEVLWLAGRDGVANCVDEAVRLYEQKENVAAAGRARAWLRARSDRDS